MLADPFGNVKKKTSDDRERSLDYAALVAGKCKSVKYYKEHCKGIYSTYATV